MYGSGFFIIILTYAAAVILLFAMIYRTVLIWRMPVHLRWELTPFPGEKGKDSYGGSHLEEHEWWTKKRKKSIVNEIVYMLKEILYLKNVRENNASLWLFSLPFHWGLYLLIFMAVLLCIDTALSYDHNLPVLILGYAGYILGIYGTFGLLVKRVVDVNLRSYSSFSNYFNLVFLLCLHLSGFYSIISYDLFPDIIAGFIRSLIYTDIDTVLPQAIIIHIVIIMLFLIYMPFTNMIHFMAKYFTYHSVKWNDEPMNDKMAENISMLLSRTVSWSARHIEGDGKKKWMDVAQQDIKNEKTGQS